MKEKNPKLDNEDEGSNPTEEGSNSMKKVKNKWSTYNVIIAEMVLILRINVSIRIWT